MQLKRNKFEMLSHDIQYRKERKTHGQTHPHTIETYTNSGAGEGTGKTTLVDVITAILATFFFVAVLILVMAVTD